MEWIEWVFSGIGTQLISIFIGIIIGAYGGYKFAKKSCFNQIQNAGAHSQQIQIGEVNNVG